MIIREAKIADIPVIADFQVSMAAETENIKLDLNTVRWGVNKVFYDKATGTYLVAEQDEKIVASLLMLYEWSDWRNGQVIWIHSVYVKPEYRKHGIFKEMYSHLKKLVAENENCKGLRLYVDKTNTNAMKVYESLGMSGDHYIVYEWMKPEVSKK
jgi:ribosomal protein S18 acetylase RimI-like enzyme